MSLRTILLVACLASSAVAPALAATPVAESTTAACPAALAGEYQLDGVMETGSGLLLRVDCGFEWYFSYGALDLGARGTWTGKDATVELTVVDMGYPEQYPQAKFERMRLRIDGTALVPSWPWDMDAFQAGAERGRYERLEP
jgi:hypothetical protein